MPIVRKIYTLLLDFIETIVLVGAVFLIIYAFLFRPYQVSGESMYPSFYDGEYVLTNLITLQFSHVNRGDVVVFRAPPNPDKDYIKRIIGLPGERIMIKDGRVFINGRLLDESPYLSAETVTVGQQFLPEGKEITIPANTYFVMGDNREFSSDSREWGFVSKDKIIGKSLIIYWPPGRFKLLEGVNYSLRWPGEKLKYRGAV